MVDNQGPRADNSHPSRSVAVREENSAPVAQLDRVPGYEPGGREFESLRARHIKTTILKDCGVVGDLRPESSNERVRQIRRERISNERSEPEGGRAGARHNLSGRATF